MLETKAAERKILIYDKRRSGRILGLVALLLSFFFPSLSRAGYGNPYLVTGSQPVTLNTSFGQMSYRFTVQSFNAVSAVQLYVQAMGSPVTYVLALQGDSAGSPSGVDGASQTFLVNYPGWISVAFPSNANLIPGNVYHLIVRPASLPPSPNNWAAFAATLPLNNLYPFNDTPDPHAGVLVNGGGSLGWVGTQPNPVYILTLNGAPPAFEGVPYAAYLWKSIDGNGGLTPNWVSQKFTYNAGSSPSFNQVQVYLQAAGAPNSALNCRLTDETSPPPVTVATGSLAASAVAASPGWVTFNLSPSFSFIPNHIYRLAFTTLSGAANSNAYQILVANAASSAVTQTSLTFQGTAGTFATSAGGSSWLDDFASDAPFNFVPVPPTPTPTAGPVTPAPTPSDALSLDENFFNPNNQVLGMDVRIDKGGEVKVLVFNIVGEEVEKLVDQQMNPGNYRFTWDGRNGNGSVVGNAVYLIIVVQPSGHTIKKVIVLK